MRRLRTTIGVIAVAALGAGLFALPRVRVTAAPSTGFRDVPATYWAAGSIRRLSALGIAQPDSTGAFRPEEAVGRAEFAHWLLAARHIQPAPPADAPFPDVPAAYPFAGDAETAYRLALLDLDQAGDFLPAAPVTREQALLAAIRVAGKDQFAHGQDVEALAHALPFPDAPSIDPVYLPYVAAGLIHGWAQGSADGRFQPHHNLTRAEAAALISRLLLPDAVSDQTAMKGQSPEASLVALRGHGLRPQQEIILLATAYGAGEPWLSDTTYTGIPVRRGLVAVDPRVIPLGSVLYIEGYGYALAADTGSAIKGQRIDLYSQDAKEVADFGAQERRIWVLE